MDWGAGAYERVAAGLLPAARALVAAAAPRPGERVLDVGCGTGNAALLAAERGASVMGVDPAERLLDFARAGSQARGLDASFLAADAARLPLADDSKQVVLSCFGVIFASDPHAAAAEMARVAGGEERRIALTAWLPEGAIAEAMRARSRALAHGGPPAGPAPFRWHDADALGELFAPLGFAVEIDEQQLSFTAASPAQFLDQEMRDHPAWTAARGALEARGELAGLREEILAIFTDANENPEGFCLSSRYVVALARPQP